MSVNRHTFHNIYARTSVIMKFTILAYLVVKTLVNPYFDRVDLLLARFLHYSMKEKNPEWIKIIASSLVIKNFVYLPEARKGLLFALGLYFPKEK